MRSPALLVLTLGVITAPVTIARAQVPALPSVTSQTMQVTVREWASLSAPKGQPARLVPILETHVLIDRTNDRAKIVREILPDTPDYLHPAMLVHNGKVQYKFERFPRPHGFEGVPDVYYRASDSPPVAQGIVAGVSLAHSGLALALGIHKKAREFMAAPGETLDGKAVDVYTRTYNGKNNKQTYQNVYKLFVDKATHLPLRYSFFFVGQNGVTTEIAREEFTGWIIDAPIAPSRFVWTPPAGAIEREQPIPVANGLLVPGTLAPDFTVAKYGGGNLKLSDYRGKVVILDFWAPWCKPCQVAMPHLEKIHQMTQTGGDVVTLGVCVWDTKASYDRWTRLNQSKYTFTLGFDPHREVQDSLATRRYGVKAIPTTFVIDRDGIIAAAIVGYGIDGTGRDDRLEKSLAKIGVKMAAQTVSAK